MRHFERLRGRARRLARSRPWLERCRGPREARSRPARHQAPRRNSLRRAVLDAFPNWLLDLMLRADHLYRTLFVPISYCLHRRGARESLAKIVQSSVVSEVHLEATNRCNAACRFCAYRVMERPKGSMTSTDFRRYVDQIVAAGVRNFDLTAIVGDPFTDKLLFERLEYLKIRSVETIDLTTNAISMWPAKADQLVSFADWFPGRITVHISFGGFDRKTYHEIFQVDRFESVVANMVHLLERKRERGLKTPCMELHVRCPLSKMKGPVYDLFFEYESCGLLEIRRRVNRALRYGNWGGKVLREDIESVGLRAATIPRSFFGPCDLMFSRGVIVTLGGVVNACACRDVEVSLPIGNLNDASFMEIIRGERRYQLMAGMLENRIPRFCRGCSEYRSIFSPEAKFYRSLLKVYRTTRRGRRRKKLVKTECYRRSQQRAS